MNQRNKSSMWVLVCGALVLEASSVHALPVIQELLYDAVGADAPGVFTELAGEANFDLTGWSLVGINGSNGEIYRTVNLTGAIIPADGILVIATSSATGVYLTERDWIGSVDWQNGPDAVHLKDPNGIVIDALQYGDAGAFNAGEGFWAPDVFAGQSLARDFLKTDTDNNFLDFVVVDNPTPGRIPGGTQPVPEPGTVLLVGLGLAGIRRCARRPGKVRKPTLHKKTAVADAAAVF